MTPEANRIRHQALVNMDWRALAQDWIPRAKKEGRYMVSERGSHHLRDMRLTIGFDFSHS